MARETFLRLKQVWQLGIAIMASGQNPDGTDYTLPVSVSGTSSPAVTATEVASGAGDAAAIVATPGLRLLGFTITDSGGVDIAKAAIRNGTTAADPVIARGSADIDESRDYIIPGGGVPCAAGVFVDRNGGTSTITLYTAVIS
jgi:hypothetical protein